MVNLRKALLAIFMIIGGLVCSALTPAQIMQKTTNALKNATGVSASFKISSSYGTSIGTFKSKGNKFSFVSNQSSVWYDGKAMWTTNHKTKETTIMVPTAQEIRESNPLEYIKSNATLFTPTIVSQTDKSKYVLKLQPKSGSRTMPNLELTVNSTSFKPIKIKILEKGSKPIEITLTNVNYSARPYDSEFQYPKSKFSGYDLVDLR